MKQVTCQLQSITPYSQSRPHNEPKLNKEIAEDYEARTWKHRLHVDKASNEIFIPAIAMKNAISEAAKYLNMQIPGKGKSTYTKHFEAGVMPMTDKFLLGIKPDDVEGERLFLNSDGRRNGGTRVWKTYPIIPHWEIEATFAILDDVITEDIFRKVLEGAGQFIGIGRWRPRNNGMNGRFGIGRLDWTE